jgi:hypothetical protein
MNLTQRISNAVKAEMHEFMSRMEQRIVANFNDDSGSGTAENQDNRKGYVDPELLGDLQSLTPEEFAAMKAELDALTEDLGTVMGKQMANEIAIAQATPVEPGPVGDEYVIPQTIFGDNIDLDALIVKLKLAFGWILVLEDKIDGLQDDISDLEGQLKEEGIAGAKGDPGDAGATGAEGPMGPQGLTGPTGPPPNHELDLSDPDAPEIRWEVTAAFAAENPSTCTQTPDGNGRYWGPWTALPRGAKGEDGQDGVNGTDGEDGGTFYEELRVVHNNYHHYYCCD